MVWCVIKKDLGRIMKFNAQIFEGIVDVFFLKTIRKKKRWNFIWFLNFMGYIMILIMNNEKVRVVLHLDCQLTNSPITLTSYLVTNAKLSRYNPW